MSYWTYLNGSIKVSVMCQPFYTKESLASYIDWALSEIRKEHDITGSERDVMIGVNLLDRNGWIGDGPYSRDEYCEAQLSLSGSFRDREFPETYKETMDFINALIDYFEVDRISVDVWNDVGDNTKHITSLCLESNESTCINLDDLQDIDNDGLWHTRMKHMNEFKHFYCTKERMIEVINLLNLMPFKVFEDVMDSHPIDRRIDWDYSYNYIKWLLDHNLELPNLNEEYIAKLRKIFKKEKVMSTQNVAT